MPAVEARVVEERPLTLFLNAQEIVTVMTIRDYPDYLALGYLLNQNMLRRRREVTGVDYDEDIETVVVRTRRATDYEATLRKKTLTSGCAQGTVFGDLMERFEATLLDPDARLRTSWLYALSRAINQQPSLYLAAGAIHGCVLCEEARPLVYMEDVGRHNAVDKIAGYMFRNRIGASGKIMYTTGRLTSEMVIKTVTMGIPILISRSGFTAWGVEPRPPGRPHADRARPRQAFRRARRRGPPGLRCRCVRSRRGGAAPPAQGKHGRRRRGLTAPAPAPAPAGCDGRGADAMRERPR